MSAEEVWTMYLEDKQTVALHRLHQPRDHTDYEKAVNTITEHGYAVKGIVIDGMRSLFDTFASYMVQMCQYHMLCIVEWPLPEPSSEGGQGSQK